MIGAIRRKAAEAARVTTLSVAGGLALAAGLVFFTIAGWIYLADILGQLEAALIIGAIYCVLAFILFAVAKSTGSSGASHSSDDQARRRVDPEKQAAASHLDGLPPLAQAFFFGLEAGLKSDKRPRDQ